MPDNEEDDPKNFEVKEPGGFFFAGWIIAVLVLMVATAGLVLAREHWIGRQTADLTQQAAAGPHVLVAQVSRMPATRNLRLPATVRGFDETEIYAKVPGYLKSIYVDKGDRVRAGQVLAKIESPETDQQVANYRANYRLALVTDVRDSILVTRGVIARQDYDNQHAIDAAGQGAAETVRKSSGLRNYSSALRWHNNRAQRRPRPPGARRHCRHQPDQRDRGYCAAQAATGFRLCAAKRCAFHEER